jgi:predicted component of type VI protein secretion system
MANSYYQLVMKTGPTPGKSFPLEKSEIHLGRDVANEVFVNDAEVSRRHARLTVQAGNFMLEDLGSTNGTFVNSQRLTGPRMLRPGDVIQLGENVSLSFEPPQYDPNATMVSEPGTVIAPPLMAASQPPPVAAQPPPPQQPAYVPPAPPPQQPEYVPPAPPPQQPAYVPPAPPPVQPAYAGRVPQPCRAIHGRCKTAPGMAMGQLRLSGYPPVPLLRCDFVVYRLKFLVV